MIGNLILNLDEVVTKGRRVRSAAAMDPAT